MMRRLQQSRFVLVVPVLLLAACSRKPAAAPVTGWSPVGPVAAPADSQPATTDYVDEYSKYATYSNVEKDLYVGGRVLAPPPGTRAVLCLSHLEDKYKVDFPNWQPIDDGGPAPSIEWLQEQVKFIDTQRKAGRQVYVHCDVGYSRAPMVTTAYLMLGAPVAARQAQLEFLKSRRDVGPNIHFMNLLSDWEDELKLPAAAKTQGRRHVTSHYP